MKFFFDGGCRPNPGTMEIAVVAAGKETVLRDLGFGTSTDAEWLALIHALTLAQALKVADVVLLGDAANVVDKVNGTMKCRGAEVAHLAMFRSLAVDTAPRVRYVRRTQNLAGIALARRHDR